MKIRTQNEKQFGHSEEFPVDATGLAVENVNP